jgi:hypothetical protein
MISVFINYTRGEKMSTIHEDLLDELFYSGPKEFSATRISSEENLFAVRAALVYTPTSHIPPGWVGRGPLDVWLPLAIPTIQEYCDCRSRQSPRLWVDLLQRATGKIRWLPNIPARVHIMRFDYTEYEERNLCGKSLVDALKVSTTGRIDKRRLYYFGAIRDDNGFDLAEFLVAQKIVDSPAEAGMRVVVEKLNGPKPLTLRPKGRPLLIQRSKG